jgi:ribosomal protein S18 acetylase RimI-like enzyme
MVLMDYKTQPLSTLSMQETAELFNRSFEGYFVPVQFTVDSFVAFAQRDSIDFEASQVLLLDSQPVGLGLIAIRDKTSRMGGFGIASKIRRQGAGTWFVKQLLEQARLRGETHMYLEVIRRNEVAAHLYEKHGFVRIRRLFGFNAERPTGSPDDRLQACRQALVLDMTRGYCFPDLPWQLDAETLQLPNSFGYRLEDAFVLISNPQASRVSFRTLVVSEQARRQGQAVRLLNALFAEFPGKIWQVPAIFPEEMGSVFLRVGMKMDTLSQWQMVCRL